MVFLAHLSGSVFSLLKKYQLIVVITPKLRSTLAPEKIIKLMARNVVCILVIDHEH